MERLRMHLNVLLGGCAVVVMIGAALAMRVYVAPLDISGTLPLPGRVQALKGRDEIAYPAHVALGTILQRAGGDSVAVGLQWLKAAAHARTAEEIDKVGNGLARAVRRSPNPERVTEEICSYLQGGVTGPRQAAALDDAGVSCAG